MNKEEQMTWEYKAVKRAEARWKLKYPGFEVDDLLDQYTEEDGTYWENWDVVTHAAATDYHELKNFIIIWKTDGNIVIELHTRHAQVLERYDARENKFTTFTRRRWTLEDRERLASFLTDELDSSPAPHTAQWLERCIKGLRSY